MAVQGISAYGKSDHRNRLLPTALVFLLLTVLPHFTCAQDIDGSTTTSRFMTSTTISTITTSSPHTGLSTSFTTTAPTNTTSSSPSRATKDAGEPPLGDPFSDSRPPDATQQRNENAFNYYFLILAAFAVAIAGFLWWVQRRRKRRKEQMRLSGHNALARDLDGWATGRRWMHGTWRHNQAANTVRHEEGLNEHGEAPPPYQPKNDVTIAQSGTTQDPTSGLTIPLRTLSREGIGPMRPPEYQETYESSPNVRQS